MEISPTAIFGLFNWKMKKPGLKTIVEEEKVPFREVDVENIIARQRKKLKVEVKSGAIADKLNEKGIAPLHYFALYGMVKKIEKAAYQNLNVRDKRGNTPLIYAIAGCKTKAFHALLKHGVNPNLTNNKGDYALTSAFQFENEEMARFLIKKMHSHPKKLDSQGYSFIHYAACLGMKEKVEEFLFRGADINRVAKDGSTPIHQAILGGSEETALYLIDQGCDLSIGYGGFFSALGVAIRESKWKLAKVILEKLENEDPILLDKLGYAAFHYAAYLGSLKKIEEYLALRVDIDLKTRDGFTPLQIARLGKQKKVQNLLIKNGAASFFLQPVKAPHYLSEFHLLQR